MPADLRVTDEAGLTLGMRWTPVDAVGLYVPGGKAAYPSSVLMNAIPARVAGVARVAMCVPSPEGTMNPLVLAAARRAGVSEIYRVGGAQAVAALAYGTPTIAPVDRIVGPGNAYVAEAKRQVFGRVGIDGIAGPSEVVIVAAAGNDPRLVAVDLLAQAEHDEAAQAILITDDAAFADAVGRAVALKFPVCPGPLSRGRAGRRMAPASWCAIGTRPRRWSTGLPRSTCSSCCPSPKPCSRASAMPAPSFSARIAPKRLATTLLARTTCFLPGGPRGSPRVCRSMNFSSEPPGSPPTPPGWPMSALPQSLLPKRGPDRRAGANSRASGHYAVSTLGLLSC